MSDLPEKEPVAPTVEKKEDEVLDKEREDVQKGLVEEVKNLRKKNQDLTDQLSQKKPDDAPKDDVESKIEAVLQRERVERAKTNRQTAEERFRNKHKEFHEDNDLGGIKFNALLREVGGFNTSGLTEVDDFMTIFEKAQRLITTTSKVEDVEKVEVDPSTPRESSIPRATNGTKLSPKELEVIKQNGWTEERYLKLKAAQPHFIQSLLG